MATGAETYMGQQRPVDPQLDLRNLLTAIGGVMSRPQTGYAGLTAQQVAQSAGNTMDALTRQQQLLQAAQQGAVQQERAKFEDAMRAQQMSMESQRLDLAKASHALQVMAQQAAMERARKQDQWAEEDRARETAMRQQLEDIRVPTPAGEVPLSVLASLGSLGSALAKPQTAARPTTWDKNRQVNMDYWASQGVPEELVEALSGVDPAKMSKTYRQELDKFNKGTLGGGVIPRTVDELQGFDNTFFAPYSSLPIEVQNILRTALGASLLSTTSVNPQAEQLDAQRQAAQDAALLDGFIQWQQSQRGGKK